jgi:hypothetical protein
MSWVAANLGVGVALTPFMVWAARRQQARIRQDGIVAALALGGRHSRAPSGARDGALRRRHGVRDGVERRASLTRSPMDAEPGPPSLRHHVSGVAVLRMSTTLDHKRDGRPGSPRWQLRRGPGPSPRRWPAGIGCRRRSRYDAQVRQAVCEAPVNASHQPNRTGPVPGRRNNTIPSEPAPCRTTLS